MDSDTAVGVFGRRYQDLEISVKIPFLAHVIRLKACRGGTKAGHINEIMTFFPFFQLRPVYSRGV